MKVKFKMPIYHATWNFRKKKHVALLWELINVQAKDLIKIC